ncbi:hypothetical protein G9A89_000927 [Geosiphon pyriformis]|nr:hypothetical protein G9A89_000927 [Geosiphon pyriformis]
MENDPYISNIRPPFPPPIGPNELIISLAQRENRQMRAINAWNAYLTAFRHILQVHHLTQEGSLVYRMASAAWSQEPRNRKKAYQMLADEAKAVFTQRNLELSQVSVTRQVTTEE